MGEKRYNAKVISPIKPDPAKRLRELEAENARLKREVALLTVDTMILREVTEENRSGSAPKSPSGK